MGGRKAEKLTLKKKQVAGAPESGIVLVKNFTRFRGNRNRIDEVVSNLGLPDYRHWTPGEGFTYVVRDIQGKKITDGENVWIVAAYGIGTRKNRRFVVGAFPVQERKAPKVRKIMEIVVEEDDYRKIKINNRAVPEAIKEKIFSLIEEKEHYYIRDISAREMSAYVNVVLREEGAYKLAENIYLCYRETGEVLKRLVKSVEIEPYPVFLQLEYTTEDAKELIYQSMAYEVRMLKNMSVEEVAKKEKDVVQMLRTLVFFAKDYPAAAGLKRELEELQEKVKVWKAEEEIKKAESGKVNKKRLKEIASDESLPEDLRKKAVKILTDFKQAVVIRKPKKE